MIEAYIICYKNKVSERIYYSLIKNIKEVSLKKSKLIIVIGGDGFMLQTLKKFHQYKKPFYGVNSGDYGFLMNKYNSSRIIKDISSSKALSIHPLEMIVRNKLNKFKKIIAINEVSILRQSRQAASLSIKVGSGFLIKKLRGDGMLVSTPAGSTAYNLSVHGPILNLDSKKIAITPVSPFRPRRWKGKVVSDKSLISINNSTFDTSGTNIAKGLEGSIKSSNESEYNLNLILSPKLKAPSSSSGIFTNNSLPFDVISVDFSVRHSVE